MEETVTFFSEKYEIEGRFENSSQEKGVVITHPHPLYGGDMHNNVVAVITRTFREKGYTTLRFNFRGVGSSQGSYGDGIGEQEDVLAAVSYLADIGIKQIDLGGYSFGAWVNALAVKKDMHIENMVMISPPIAFIDFSSISDISSLKLIVSGNRDDIAPAELIKKSYRIWNPRARIEIVKGADHFYGGYLDKLGAVLTAYLEGLG